MRSIQGNGPKQKLCQGVLYFFISSGFLVSCGHRTSPRPYDIPSPLHSLTVFQRGDELRLSWQLEAPHKKKHEKATGEKPHEADGSAEESQNSAEEDTQRFNIKVFRTPYGCLACDPQPMKTVEASSDKELSLHQGKFYYDLTLEKTLDRYLFQIVYQDRTPSKLPPPIIAEFLQFQEFPPVPSIKMQVLPFAMLKESGTSALPPLIDEKLVVLFRLSWPETLEKYQFQIAQQGIVVSRPILYKVNLYKKSQTASGWPDFPINDIPIEQGYWVDALLKTDPLPRYQIRLVDDHGNESLPSVPLDEAALQTIMDTENKSPTIESH